MSSGFKLIIPGALALFTAVACLPDLASLSADYQADTGGSSGTDPGSDGGQNSSNAGRSSGGGGAPVTHPVCENNTKDKNESDVDCGGTSTCDKCANGSTCTANRDCQSTFCKGTHCADPSCTDKVQNGDETAADCGGSCTPCDIGIACSVNNDCDGRYCKDGACGDHCLSGVREADETDKDCGGERCDACGDKLHCLVAGDCASGICSNSACVPATCSDGVKNQGESDTDCGSVCNPAKPCPVAAHCTTPADCKTWICSAAGKCLDDIVVEPSAVIDDFEAADPTLHLPALEGRVGNWYPFGDGTSTYSLGLFAIKRGDSVTGLHTTGKDFKTWGSGVGVDLKNGGSGASTKLPYDASKYAGVTFWARAETALPIQFVLPDVDTDGADNTSPPWKVCVPPNCDHHYFKPVSVGTTWQRFTVLWTDLQLEPGGDPVPTKFKPEAIISAQFRFAIGQNYDVYVDDIAFVK